MQDTLLIEILTEELPPKSLKNLSYVFSQSVFSALEQENLLTIESKATAYATPRRLAVSITAVLDAQSGRKVERKGPSVTSAFDVFGKPTPALLGFAHSCKTNINSLEKRLNNKGVLHYISEIEESGKKLGSVLIVILQHLLHKLPVAKVMRWGTGTAQFVRPAHVFFMLHGDRVLNESEALLGLYSNSAETFGHRFLSKDRIVIPHADEYAKTLYEKGHVIASFEERKKLIWSKLLKSSEGENGKIFQDEALLDEVTALVEYPEVYVGKFNQKFLNIPQECLILTMKQHQKYFPIMNLDGRLLPCFLIVSNIKTDSPTNIILGNERVLWARLADAQFFFDQDRKRTLASRVEDLNKVVYHGKLGTQRERVDRICAIARVIGARLGGDILSSQAGEAATLSKADLLTDMVREFPELQGIMGCYYAKHDGVSDNIALAIEDHYKPRFSGDVLPRNVVAICVALADKLEMLVGMFGVEQIPTGDKDPFALRRHALGIIRILIQKNLDISLKDLVILTQESMPPNIKGDWMLVVDFLLDRARSYFLDQGHDSRIIESVLSPFGKSNSLDVLADIIPAATVFFRTDEGLALANANKRIKNILKKLNQEIIIGASPKTFEKRLDESLFESNAEALLWDCLQEVGNKSLNFKSEKNFSEALKILALLAPFIQDFFEQVLVNVNDPKIRENRIILLQFVRIYMNQVADLSLMAT